MLETLARPIPAAPDRPLKPVERRILLHRAHGLTYGQIEARERTTRTRVVVQITNLHILFGVTTSAYAVALAHRAGLLPVEAYARPVLDEREQLILEAIGAGLSNRELAPLVGTDPKTVSNEVTALYRVLGAQNRPNAVHLGFCTGLLGGETNV